MWGEIASKQECNGYFFILFFFFFYSISLWCLEWLTRQHFLPLAWESVNWNLACMFWAHTVRWLQGDGELLLGRWHLVAGTAWLPLWARQCWCLLYWAREETACTGDAWLFWNSAGLPNRSRDELLIWRSQGDLKNPPSKEMVALLHVCIPPAFYSLSPFSSFFPLKQRKKPLRKNQKKP